MNSISTTLIYFDRDYMLLTHKQKLDIVTVIMLYVFGLCKSSEMTSVLKEHLGWVGQRAIEFRKILQGKGSIQKCLKFYVYDRVINSSVKAEPELFGVTADDADFVKRVLKLQHPNVRFLKKGLEVYNKNGFPPRSMSSFETGLEWAARELETTAAKFVSKQFRYLTQSGQMDTESLVADMRHQAIYAIYRAYPKISTKLHMKNIGVRSIHNRGINIHKEQGTQSRKRLIKNEDGTFSGTLLSFDHAGFEASQSAGYMKGRPISVCNHLMVGMDGKSVAYERPNDVERQRDLKKTIEQVTDNMRGPSPKTFLRLLMGEYNAKFSKWLGQPNDDASESMDVKEYSEKCREYLDIPRTDARKFVLTLRKELRDFQN
jgi:hypothetical protein